MDFRFSEEEDAFRKEVHEFIEAEMTDEIRSRWLGGLLDTPERQQFVTKMAERGWLSMGFPEEYGGTGEAMPLAQYILNEELHKAQAPIVGKNLGVVVNTQGEMGSAGPTYLFTQLNEHKPPMIAEATARAREAAVKFAEDSGGTLGSMRHASQGLFEILPRDQAPGVMQESQIDKTLRVVTTIDYFLAD